MGLLDRFKGSAQDRFVAEVLDVLLRVDGVIEAAYVPDGFRIDYRKAGAEPGSAPVMMFLANVFAECQGVSTQERGDRIAKLVSIAALPEVGETWEDTKPLLRPVIRSAAFGLSPEAVKVPLRRPAMPYLAELVVIDMPTAMRYVTPSDLEKWGVTAEEAFAAAQENLAPSAFRLPEGGKVPEQPVAVRLADADGDAYFASMPLLPGWLESMRPVAGGQPIALVSDPSGLLLVGAPEPPKSIGPLVKLALEEYRSAVRSISPVPYTVDTTGSVVPLEVPRDDPAWPLLHEAEATLAYDVYAQQTATLRQQCELTAVETYVAALMRLKSNKDDSIFTVATWADVIESLLPYADYIGLGPVGDVFLLPFEAAIEELGLTPEPDLYPARYRVHAWPDPQTMAHLRTLAVSP